MKHYTKAQAIAVVVACAEKYRSELANRNILFICQDKHRRISAIEFSFDASNFMHLTGLKTKKNGRTKTVLMILSAQKNSMINVFHIA